MYVLLLYNKCSENSRAQIVFRTDIFQNFTLGAPDYSDEEVIYNLKDSLELTAWQGFAQHQRTFLHDKCDFHPKT